MRWRNMRRSTKVRDLRRASRSPSGMGGSRMRIPSGRRVRIPSGGGSRAGGGLGIGGIIIMVIIAWALGINPLTLLTGGTSGGGGQFSPSQQQTSEPFNPGQGDELADFASRVLGDTEDVWATKFDEQGMRYDPPTLTLFSGQVQSACGFASSASGPFYCPPDRGVFLDLSFFAELSRRFGAPGDFAQAYVIAHEVGHHIQNQLGILGRFNEARRRMSERDANAMSVRVELQADCLAGVWGHDAAARGLLERGDLDEALNAASQIGDDTMQRRAQGYVVPESFSHGTAEQRVRWFGIGFDGGDMNQCDTFEARQL
ncbi:MAG: neutral zinc metallopeptidase [Hyphomicrobiales bacterium]